MSLRSWGVGEFGVPPGSLLRSHLGSKTLRKHCYLLLRSHLGTGIPPKTLLFAAPEPRGRRNTSENTAVRCSRATWVPEYLRKHCCSLLRSHLWAPEYLRKHCCSLFRSHLLLRSHLGTSIPPKGLMFAAPEPLGHRNASENTAVRCSITTGR